MRPATFVIVFLAATLAVACVPQGSNVVRPRAAYDFDCPEERVEVREIAGNTYEAKGCGRTEVYVCNGVGTSCARDSNNTSLDN